MKPGVDAKLQLRGNLIYDIQVGPDGDIETEDSLDTAILVSLFSDRRVSESEQPSEYKRRGWVGNESTPGIQIGSRVWLYDQARITNTTLSGISDAASDCLQWMVDQGIAKGVSATATATSTGVSLNVSITRPTSEVEQRFYDLWNNTATGESIESIFTAADLPFVDNTNSVVFDKTMIMSTSEDFLGLEKNWSFSVWYKPFDTPVLSTDSHPVFYTTSSEFPSTPDNKSIEVYRFDNHFTVYVKAIVGLEIKEYEVYPTPGVSLNAGTWYHIGATYSVDINPEVITLRIWVNGIEMLVSENTLVKIWDFQFADFLADDVPRSIVLGSGVAGTSDNLFSIYSLALWKTTLTPTEILTIYGDRTEFDYAKEQPGYTSFDTHELRHWFRIGNDVAPNIGKNYAFNSSNHLNTVTVDNTDIVVDAPGPFLPFSRNENSVYYNSNGVASRQYLQTPTSSTLGIANNWTFAGWFQSPVINTVTHEGLFSLRQTTQNTINVMDILTFEEYIAIHLHDSAGVAFKVYWVSPSNPRDRSYNAWFHLGFTWDGTDLRVWWNGIEATSIASTPRLEKTIDDPGVQTDTARYITAGALVNGVRNGVGLMYSIALWKTALPPAIMGDIYGDGDEYDLSTNRTGYTYGGNLKYWYRMGVSGSPDIGKNYAFAGPSSLPLVSSGTVPIDNSSLTSSIPYIPNFPNPNSAEFTGLTQYLGSVPGSLGFSNNWSLSLWYKPPPGVTQPNNNGDIIRVQASSGFPNIRITQQGISGDDYIFINVNPSSFSGSQQFIRVYPLGNPSGMSEQWYHFGFTWDGTDIRVWVDGVEALVGGIPEKVEAATGSFTQNDNTPRQISIGNSASLGGQFEGRVYSLSIWSAVLSPTNMVTIYNARSEFNLTLDQPGYTESSSLTSWYRLGAAQNIGKNYASILLDLSSLGTDPLDSNDIVVDKPS